MAALAVFSEYMTLYSQFLNGFLSGPVSYVWFETSKVVTGFSL